MGVERGEGIKETNEREQGGGGGHRGSVIRLLVSLETKRTCFPVRTY